MVYLRDIISYQPSSPAGRAEERALWVDGPTQTTLGGGGGTACVKGGREYPNLVKCERHSAGHRAISLFSTYLLDLHVKKDILQFSTYFLAYQISSYRYYEIMVNKKQNFWRILGQIFPNYRSQCHCKCHHICKWSKHLLLPLYSMSAKKDISNFIS